MNSSTAEKLVAALSKTRRMYIAADGATVFEDTESPYGEWIIKGKNAHGQDVQEVLRIVPVAQVEVTGDGNEKT